MKLFVFLGLCVHLATSQVFGIVDTLAGALRTTFAGDNGPATDAELSNPQGLVVLDDGSFLISDTANNKIRKVTNGIITTFAGNSTQGFDGDNGPASSAVLNHPTSAAVLPDGSIVIADKENHRIRQVSNGIITTFAGTGTGDFSGDDGLATEAELNFPAGLAVLADGTLLIADQGNHRVRRIINGTILTVAGNGTAGFSGDGELARDAQLLNPAAVAVLADGSFLIADMSNNRIRIVNTAGIITTVAGNGENGVGGDNGPATSAQLTLPAGLAVFNGSFFIADQFNYRVRKVTAGIITTIAGSGRQGFSGDNGPATAAQLNLPSAVAVLHNTVLIVDQINCRIRQVTNGVITTIAGVTPSSGAGDNGPATKAELNNPQGVAVLSDGSLVIADTGNNRVRKVRNGTITTIAGTGDFGSDGDDGPAFAARLNQPTGVAVLGDASLLIMDTLNNRIRKVTDGTIANFAGGGSPDPFSFFGGDNGPATSAQMFLPTAVAVLAGTEFIADQGNHRIRKVAGGIITTFAGSGKQGFSGDDGPATDARLSNPTGVAVSVTELAELSLFIADSSNNRIRKVTKGVITTFVGNGVRGFGGDNGPASSAQLDFPTGVAVFGSTLLIADQRNNRIRKVVNGVITTIAGDGKQAFGGDLGLASLAQFALPTGLTVLGDGSLLVADKGNGRIRKVFAVCEDCTIPQCGIDSTASSPVPLNAVPLGTCAALRRVAELPLWANDLSCASEIRDRVCSKIFLFLNSTTNCEDRKNNTDPKHCGFLSAQVTGCIAPIFQQQFGNEFCPPDTFPSEPIFPIPINFTIPPSLVPAEERDLSNLDTRPDRCLELDTFRTANCDAHADSCSFGDFISLGVLASAGGPAVDAVDVETGGTLFPIECLPSTASTIRYGWLVFLALFAVVFVGCVIGFKMYPEQKPLRARSPVLLWCGTCLIGFNALLTSLDLLLHLQVSCAVVSLSNMVAFPLLIVTYLTGAARLLFLYRWNESKVNERKGENFVWTAEDGWASVIPNKVSDWYWQRRNLVSEKTLAKWLGSHFGVYFLLFLAAQIADGTFSQGFLDSGRCQWFDINQRIAAFAAAQGVTLNPTTFNPNGFVPFSPKYSTCIFCTSQQIQMAISAYTFFLLASLLVITFLLRGVNDQYLIWRETICAIVVIFIVGVSRCVMMLQSMANQLLARLGGLDYMGSAFAVALCLLLAVSGVWPLVATRRRGRVVRPLASGTSHLQYGGTSDVALSSMNFEDKTGSLAHSTSQLYMKAPKPILPDANVFAFEDMLADPLALALFKQCAVECFVAENINYILDVMALDQLAEESEFRHRAAAMVDKYFRVGAAMELNISAVLRKQILAAFENGNAPRNVFDDATSEIMKQMIVNEFATFLKSAHVQTLVLQKRKATEAMAIVGAAIPDAAVGETVFDA